MMTMNKGIKLCQGDIIGIVNADDFIYTDTLQKVVNELKLNDNFMFTFSDLDLIDEHGLNSGRVNSLGVEHWKYKLFGHMPFLHPTMFIKKEIYQKIGLYDLCYKLSADYDFTLRLIENKIKFKKLNFATGVFRLGGQSGGLKSYVENHKLLLNHKVNPILVYINTAILLIKLYFRKIFH